jgi:tRNA 2-thiouridine synthesizing protein A
MPVIRVQDKVAECTAGDEVIAICTDPGALNDVPAWCRINGHEVLSTEQNDDEIIIRIKVGERE